MSGTNLQASATLTGVVNRILLYDTDFDTVQKEGKG